MPGKPISPSRRAYTVTMKLLCVLSALLVCALTLFLIGYVMAAGLPNLTWDTVLRLSWVVRITVGRFIITSVSAPASREVPNTPVNTSIPTRP